MASVRLDAVLSQLRAAMTPFLESLPADPLARRSPEAIKVALELLGPLYDRWFSPEIVGYEHLEGRQALVVGTHNGGNMAPDMFALMIACWRRFGAEFPAYGLAHDQVMRMPLVGDTIARLGAVPANPRNAAALLDRGATVLVYPGGDVDAFKPYRDRHVVRFGERTGFIKLALRAGVPIVPCISVGAHQTWMVLSDGREFAIRSGLKRLFRLETFPIFLALPYGLGFGPVEAHLPVPSRLRLRLLPPMELPGGPASADDPQHVRRLADHVRSTMQAELDALVSEGDFGPLAQIRRWVGS